MVPRCCPCPAPRSAGRRAEPHQPALARTGTRRSTPCLSTGWGWRHALESPVPAAASAGNASCTRRRAGEAAKRSVSGKVAPHAAIQPRLEQKTPPVSRSFVLAFVTCCERSLQSVSQAARRVSPHTSAVATLRLSPCALRCRAAQQEGAAVLSRVEQTQHQSVGAHRDQKTLERISLGVPPSRHGFCHGAVHVWSRYFG